MIKRVVEHLDEMRAAMELLRAEELEAAGRLLDDAMHQGRGVYIFGNGGSASTASHLAVDLGKNIRTGTGPRMRVLSLTDNVAWLTAVANDQGYADCFAEQLRNYLQPGDLIIAISASGDSQNVVRAMSLARDVGADRLALVGFDGGRAAGLATQCIRVDSFDYGIVESVHLFVVHILVRMLQQSHSRTEAEPLAVEGETVTVGSCHKDDILMGRENPAVEGIGAAS